MIAAIALLVIAGLIALFILALLGDWALRAFKAARDRRDRRIRDEQLRRYCITPWINKERR